LYHVLCPDSPVASVTRIRTRRPENYVDSWQSQRYLSSLKNPEGIWAPNTFLLKWYRVRFSRVNRLWCESDHSPHLVLKLRNTDVIPSLPRVPSWRANGQLHSKICPQATLLNQARDKHHPDKMLLGFLSIFCNNFCAPSPVPYFLTPIVLSDGAKPLLLPLAIFAPLVGN